MFGHDQVSLIAHARHRSPGTRSSPAKMNIQEMLSDRGEHDDRNARSSKSSQATSELSAPSRVSTGHTTESSDKDITHSRLHHRNQSLHVTWTEADVTRLAQEIYDETIAEVHLSLFGFWVREKEEHYRLAKRYIRELGLDQVCPHYLNSLLRLENSG